MNEDVSEEPIIHKEVLRDKIFDTLKSWILDGKLKPGDRIVEFVIAKKLQVSRAPLREALWLLAHHGFVTIKAHHGTFVTKLGNQDIQEILDLREVLEIYAAKKIRELSSEQSAERLKKALKRLGEAAKARDIRAFTEADFELHKELWAQSGNKQLEEILLKLATRFFGYELIRGLQDGANFNFEQHLREHKKLIDLAIGGNESTIEAGFRKVFDTFRSDVLSRIGEQAPLEGTRR